MGEEGDRADLATALRRARLAAGLSQREMARRAGLSAGYVSRLEAADWEAGGPLPSDRALRAMARVTRVSSTDLLGLRDAVRARLRPNSAPQPGGWARANGRMPYSVTVGAAEVAAEVAGVVQRNPEGSAVRTTSHLLPATDRTLHRLRSGADADRGGPRSGGRGAAPALELVIGEVEAVIVVPGPPGRARAALTVDDPDLLRALRLWFDDLAWSEERLHGRAAGA